MREIIELLSAFRNPRRREVRPAARLGDVARLLETDLLPRIIAFSGHNFCALLKRDPTSHRPVIMLIGG